MLTLVDVDVDVDVVVDVDVHVDATVDVDVDEENCPWNFDQFLRWRWTPMWAGPMRRTSSPGTPDSLANLRSSSRV